MIIRCCVRSFMPYPMNEQKFSAWLRPRLGGHVQRIESTIGAGIPDIMWLFDGKVRWIETKVTPAMWPLLRPEQVSWAMRHASHGGASFILNLCSKDDIIAVWKFPDIKWVVFGKYLKLSSTPVFTSPRKSFNPSLLVSLSM